jgi:hypothetical protein
MGYCPLVMVVSSRTDAMVTINSAYAYVDMAAPTICPLCAAIYAWCYALDFEIFRVLEGVLISVLTDFHLVRSCAAQISTTRLPSTARLPCAYRFVTSRPVVSGAPVWRCNFSQAAWPRASNVRCGRFSADNCTWSCTHPAGGTVTTKNPNAMLRRIRSSVAMVNRNSPAAIPPDVHDLIQAVTDLDNHLSWGGDPPDDWRAARFATPSVPVARRGFEPPPVDGLDPVEDIIRRM